MVVYVRLTVSKNVGVEHVVVFSAGVVVVMTEISNILVNRCPQVFIVVSPVNVDSKKLSAKMRFLYFRTF